MVARAFHGGGIDAAGRRPALLDEDARPHDAVPPRRRCAMRVERGLEDVAAPAEARLRVAFLASDLARLLGQVLIPARDLGAREVGQRPLVPLHLERAPALHDRPEAVADDGDAVGDLDDVADTLDRLRGAGVERLHLAAEHRTPLDRPDLRAGNLHVDSVDGLAVGLERDVESRDAFLAAVAELVLRLELGTLRYRKLRGPVDELAVHQLASAGAVDGGARLGVHLALGHAPLLRRGLLEHP